MKENCVLRADGLESRYPNGAGLIEANLCVRPREIVAAVGPNGAGKTTLLETLSGHRPYRGRLTLLGHAPKEEEAYKAKLAYLPEERGFPPFITGRTAARLAQDLWGQPELYPRFLKEAARLGLVEADLDRPARVLSQGTREKLALALVFAREAPLYVLDEPEAHLDPIVRKVLEDRVGELREAGKAVLFATHDVYLAGRVADTILLVKNGRVHPAKTKDPEAILTILAEKGEG